MERSIPDKIHKYPPNTPDPSSFLPAGKKYIFRLPTVSLDRSGPTISLRRSQSIDLAEREVKIDDWLVGLSLTSHYGLLHIGKALKCSPLDGLLDGGPHGLTQTTGDMLCNI